MVVGCGGHGAKEARETKGGPGSYVENVTACGIK